MPEISEHGKSSNVNSKNIKFIKNINTLGVSSISSLFLLIEKTVI